jgi:O-antigen ligase
MAGPAGGSEPAANLPLMASLPAFGRLFETRDARLAIGAAIGAALLGVLFALSAYEVSPLVLPVALVGLGFVVLTFLRPAWGAAGAMAATPLEVLNVSAGSGALSPAEAALVLVGIAWVLRVLLRPETVAKPAVRDASIIGLLVCVFIGLSFAVNTGPVLRISILWTLFYFVYLQAQSFTVAEIRLVVVAFAFGAGALGLVGAVSYLGSGNTVLYAGGALTSTRAVGTFADANYYASLLVLATLPAIALVLSKARRYAILIGPALFAIGGIAFSLSRGGISGFVAGLLVLLLWARARWIALGLIALFATLTFFNANPIVKSQQFGVVEQRLGSLRDPTHGANSRRPEIWATAIKVAEEHPFFGVGVNQFQYEAGRRGLTEYGSPLENAHSIPFSLLAETGLLGLSAFLLFAGQLGARAVRALRTRDATRYALALGFTAALLGFAVQGLTVAQIRTNIVTGAFLLTAGLVTNLADRAAAEPRAHASRHKPSSGGDSALARA